MACDECSVGGNPSAASRLRKWDRPLRMGGGVGGNWMLRDKSNSHKRRNLTLKREGGRGRSLWVLSHPGEYQQHTHHEISLSISVQ